MASFRSSNPDSIRGRRLREGPERPQKNLSLPRLASDSSSQSTDTTEEDLIVGELGWRHSKQAVGTPMKKLLAKEMSREAESKRRSPNVIARLMGLDGLPPQQPSLKQQKIASGSLQKVASSKKYEKNSTSHSSRSSRKSSMENQEFKDVFEVLDATKLQSDGSSSSRYSPQGTVNPKINEAEMAFIQQKFKVAKQLSTSEKHHNSKEFHEAIDDLDSNKDLLLKFLDQPDALFTKHLHDLQSSPPNCHFGQISTVKSSHRHACQTSDRRCKIERENSQKNLTNSNDYFVSHSQRKHDAHDLGKSSNVQLENKDGSGGLATRIVVLKPNLGKGQSTARTVSSTFSSQDFPQDRTKQTGVTSVKNRKPESLGKKRSPDDVGHLKYKSRESREIAKQVTRQMRSTLKSSSAHFSASAFKGYAGDDSSSSRSENDSTNELEVISLTSRNSSGSRSCYRASSSHTTESSVSREARRRLSERWKMTHKSVDLGVMSRGSTLGEMLAVPDRAMRLPKIDTMSEKGGNNEPEEGTEPLGISSRDGWKDGSTQNLSRSKSLPASSTVALSPRTPMPQETVSEDKYMVSKEVMQSRRVVNDSSSHRDSSPSRNSRSCRHRKGSHHSVFTSTNDVDTPTKKDFRQNHIQTNGAEGNQFKQDCVVSGTSQATAGDSRVVHEDVVDATTEDKTMSRKPAELSTSTSMLVEGEPFTSISNVPSIEEPSNDSPEKGLVPAQRGIADLESAASSKESDQPSPVSVLEAPFADDVSSGSECFGSLSADLHGLRMQLQLLKLESEAYAEGQMLVSSDEDAEEGCVPFSKEKGPAEEIMEYSYVVHVLDESGINDADFDTFIASWHSPECPLHPLVFEELEKKYTNQTSWTCFERRLLFDRVNLALLTIYKQVASPYPWVRQPNRISSRWIKNGLEDRLCRVLASQKNKGNADISDEVLAGELEWLNLGNDTDIIGREIERLLTEELVEELVAV